MWYARPGRNERQDPLCRDPERDGTLYIDNMRTAKVTDHFILAGRPVEEFTPQFTFHGFRYAEITGLPASPVRTG